tara:strand:- start:33 stop:587 length:555 start_codon:yes stop_codon:yes gene_type:complete
MAIGPGGEVTTTGLMNKSSTIAKAPDMSNLKPPAQPQEKTAPAAAPTAMVEKPEVKDPAMIAKLESLSDEEKQQLDMVLSPSLSSILTKIIPEAGDVISQFTSAEENVILPVSVVKNFARKKYPSNTEQESIQGFVTELSESQSDDDNNNVPPENIQTSNSNGMMAQEPDTMSEDTDAIDQDLV